MPLEDALVGEIVALHADHIRRRQKSGEMA
jgi:hypothetical protein